MPKKMTPDERAEYQRDYRRRLHEQPVEQTPPASAKAPRPPVPQAPRTAVAPAPARPLRPEDVSDQPVVRRMTQQQRDAILSRVNTAPRRER